MNVATRIYPLILHQMFEDLWQSWSYEPLFGQKPVFLLRCAFWLSIVYATMSWSPASLAPTEIGAGLIAAGRTQTETLVNAASAAATDRCTRNPRECLADAARLTSMIAATEHSDDMDESATTAVPLPVPDPRRQIRDAKPAHAP